MSAPAARPYPRHGRGLLAALVVAGGILGAGGSTAGAAEPERIETPVDSQAPDRALVRETYVSLLAPLPARAGSRPPACDRIGYLRFRSARGPKDPSRADAVFVAMPGIFEGASGFDQAGRNLVRTAAARGRRVELWALDRRSNCLEDHTGVEAAARAHDPQVALDYYYGGMPADGRRFEGFVPSADARFLSHVGLAQTVRDQYRVISELPPTFRRQRLFCGGHSLGGFLTAAFANWDFDGDPATTADAGYRQCAGYFAQDTRLTLDAGALIRGVLGLMARPPGAGLGDAVAGLRARLASGRLPRGPGLTGLLRAATGLAPYFNLAPIAPETLASLPILGLAAFEEPSERSSVIGALPRSTNFDTTFRVLFSRGPVGFLTGQPDLRDFSLSNEAAVGGVFDDNSDPVGILRAGLGVIEGGPVAAKNFPVPYGTPSILGFLGGNKLVIPSEERAPLYRWAPYDHLPDPLPSPVGAPGPYSSAQSEVSDIHQFARNLYEAPADFTEDYFPLQILVDFLAAAAGDRTGELRNLRYDGIPEHPALYLDAAEGLAPTLGPSPGGPGPTAEITLPGYNHLDVVTAAFDANDGSPEPAREGLAEFMDEVLGD